jgi:aldehyde dehydrogenase (NAD+)/betaine-aldehyde dehydrogenase
VEVPFGGNRKSGFGREKGQEGLGAYTRTKSITVRL